MKIRQRKSRWGDYSYMYAVKRMRVGLSPNYERGHKHAAEEIADKKRQERVRTRRSENRTLQLELDNLS